MKNLIFAVLIGALVGCESKVSADPRPQDAVETSVLSPAPATEKEVAKREFIEAFKIYRMERETYNDFENDRAAVEEMMNADMDRMSQQYQEAVKIASETAPEFRELAIQKKKEYEEILESIDAKLDKQLPRRSQAFEDLEAARARWEAARANR